MKPLVLTPYPDGNIWYLVKGIKYGDLKIPAGFESDFASVPSLFTNLFPRWGEYGLASIIHDWLYWNQAASRKTADDTFLSVMTDCGVHRWKRLTLYWAVRIFGWMAWRSNAKIASEGYSRIRTKESPPVPEWKR